MSFFDGVSNFFGGIGQGLLNMGSTAYNIFANERAHKEQQALNQQSVELANSQIQRGLEDAHNAGLSTAQYLGMNGMAGTPSLSTAGTQQVGAPDVLSPYLKAKEMKRQEKLADLEVKSVEAQMKKTDAETESIKQSTDFNSQDREEKVKQIAAQTTSAILNNQKISAEIEELKTRDYKENSEAYHIQSQTQLVRNQADKILQDMEIERDEHDFESFLHAYLYGGDKVRETVFSLGRNSSGSSCLITVPAGWKGVESLKNEQELQALINSNNISERELQKMNNWLENGDLNGIADLFIKLFQLLTRG